MKHKLFLTFVLFTLLLAGAYLSSEVSLKGDGTPNFVEGGNGRVNNALFAEVLRSKAEKGDPIAQLGLGASYITGEFGVKDNIKAVEWFRKSAEQGNARAQTMLGMAYAEGGGK